MKLCLLTLSLFIGWSVHAEQVYLLFAPDCGQQIRYRRSVEEVSAADYYTYVFSDHQDGTRYLLETDGQGSGTRSSLPDSYLSCATAVLSSRMVERINAGTDQLTILVAADGGQDYEVQPVVMATVLETRGDEITYRSPLAAFTFNTRLTVIGDNIDRAGEGATVYFEGQEGVECKRNYLFTQRHAGSAYPSITYRLSPILGLTHRDLEGNGTYSQREEITAVAVNGMPIDSYLTEQCTQAERVVSAPPVTDYVPLYVEPTVPTDTEDTVVSLPQEELATAVAYVAPAAPATDGGTHRVEAGETLYRISQRYGIEVNTLKALNGLTSNTIRVGQDLLVEVDNPAAAEVVGTPSLVTDRPTQPVTPPVSSPVIANDFHVVQSGETIASLALRFGYTEARFREFNGIADQRVALVGQQLKTSHCECPAAYPVREPEPLLASAEIPTPASRPDYTPVVVPPARPLPTGSADNPSSESTEASAPLPPAYGGGRLLHVVQEGQSLYAIARQYGVSVTDLQRLNGLGPSDVIVPLQKLYVN